MPGKAVNFLGSQSTMTICVAQEACESGYAFVAGEQIISSLLPNSNGLSLPTSTQHPL